MALALAQPTMDLAVSGTSAPRPPALLKPGNTIKSDFHRDLTQPEKDLILTKRDWVKAVYDLLQAERRGRKLYTVATAVAAVPGGKFPLLATAGQRGKSWMSVTNYNRAMQKLTINGLPRWDRLDKLMPGYRGGRPSLIQQNPQFVQDVLALWLNPRQPHLSVCWRRVATVYRRAGEITADFPPADSIAHYIRAHVSKRIIERYRSGAAQYSNTTRGHMIRRWDDVNVGDMFCSDHRIVDYWARMPHPDTPGKWVAVRLYCSTIEDVRSRYRVHSILYADQHPNHRIVAEMLWNAIKANGNCPPLYFYIDNGKDFLKQGLTMPVKLRRANGDFVVNPKTGAAYEHSVCKELGIAIGEEDAFEVLRARGYNGKEKPVEGSFGMDARLHDRMQLGFTGNTTVERARLNGEHYTGDVMRLPSIQEAMNAYEEFLEEFHELDTRSKICPAKTRAKAWTGMHKPTRAPLTPTQLDMAFLIPQAVCPLVCRTGPGWGGLRHSDWTYSNYALAKLDPGTPLMIKVPWADKTIPHHRGGSHPASIFIFHPDGRFICEATADPTVAAVARTPEEKLELGERAHTINAAAKVDTVGFQQLTGRKQMISDPRQITGPQGTRIVHAAVSPVRKKRLSRKTYPTSQPTACDIPGDDDSQLMAALEKTVFSAETRGTENEEEIKRVMEAMR